MKKLRYISALQKHRRTDVGKTWIFTQYSILDSPLRGNKNRLCGEPGCWKEDR